VEGSPNRDDAAQCPCAVEDAPVERVARARPRARDSWRTQSFRHNGAPRWIGRHGGRNVLDDVLAEGLAVVICGTAVGDRSGRTEAYYGARGNKFWQVLFRTKLTPRQFRPEEYSLVLAHDIGLTDLVKGRAAMDRQLEDEDYDVEGFRKRMAEHRPAIVAFNGKEAAKRCLGRETVTYGRQKDTFEKAVVYVLPSTSDRAHDYWDEKPWVELAAEVRKVRKGM
jgi:TDG/mug DNA glycosylase family protein